MSDSEVGAGQSMSVAGMRRPMGQHSSRLRMLSDKVLFLVEYRVVLGGGEESVY